MHHRLNLLPPERKKSLELGRTLAFVQTLLLAVLVAAVFASATLITVQVQVTATHEDLTARYDQTTDEYKEVAREVNDMNAFLTLMDGVRTRARPISPLLRSILDTVPSGIRVDRLHVATSGHIAINGLSSSRESTLAFETALKENPMLEAVDSPITNILSPGQSTYDFTMDIFGTAERLAAEKAAKSKSKK